MEPFKLPEIPNVSFRWAKLPANRTSTELALALAVVHLAALLCAVVWLAEIIAYQKGIIRYLAPWLR